jgi:hypothetical protein|tara:strand:+ start:1944 stop:2075 length:132 start_codon:yes stop_codon:yes gene_type:complete
MELMPSAKMEILADSANRFKDEAADRMKEELQEEEANESDIAE